MTLTIDQAVPRFQTNETRFDTFVNGGVSATWTTSGGSVQPSITKFLADRASYVDSLAASTLSASTAAKNAAEAARDEAVEAAETATSAAALFDPDNYQPKDDTLTSLAALGTAPGKIAYTTGVDTWAEAEITAAGRALLDDTDAAAQRATLGLGAAATAGFLDEDDFAADSATAAPSQQSTKAFVNSTKSSIINQVIGVGQTWQAVSRTAGTNYQNTTGRPIVVVGYSAFVAGDLVLSVGAVSPPTLVVSTSGTNAGLIKYVQAIIPAAWYYKFSGDYTAFMELR